MIDELKKDWCDASGAPLPGAVLLAAHALFVRGLASDEIRARVAGALGVPPSDFDAIVAFHARLVAPPAADPLILCRGVSCRINGAMPFHARLRELLAAAGVETSIQEVHCLNQCEHGPNLRLGDRIVCTGKRRVVEDVRRWRPPGAGPLPVGVAGPPVLG